MRIPAIFLLAIFSLSAPVWALKPPPEKTQRMYQLKIDEAGRAYQKKDFATTESLLKEADALWPNQTATLNLQGAVYYQKKEYDAALVSFQAVLATDPVSYTGLVNVSEVKLAQKKYDEALDYYEKILNHWPGDEIIEFKYVVATYLGGDHERAKMLAEKITHPGKTAAYFYAHAAVEFAAGNRDEALKWIQQSEPFFGSETVKSFRDTLDEQGWLKKDAPTSGK